MEELENSLAASEKDAEKQSDVNTTDNAEAGAIISNDVSLATPIISPDEEKPVDIEIAKPSEDPKSSDIEIIDTTMEEAVEILPERTFSEEELATLEAQIDALEKIASEDKPTDSAPATPEIAVVDNTEDSQELADEVGISDIFDAYGREILEPVFENRLRMSKNGVKLAYSKLKNTILSYRDIKQKFVSHYETFKYEEKLLFRMEIGEDSVFLFCAKETEALDKEVFFHVQARGAEYKETPTKLTVKREKEKETVSSLERALTLIDKIMTDEGIPKLKVYAPTAYAQRYPLNPTAVLRGKETREPDEGCYNSEEYEPIDGEITMNIIKELMGPNHSIEDKKGKARLDAMRQQATTIKGAVAMAEPIVYFYDSAVNSDNTHAYINVQQVLNDKFMGKIIPQQFFAVAENSERVIELNLLALKQIVSDCNENPKYLFVTRISSRMLVKKTSFEKLLKAVVTDNQNLILAFDSALLEVLGQTGLDALNALKQHDVKIMIDGTENAGLKILTEYPFDYLRFDARYYKENEKATVSHLDMLTGYAKVQGIMTTSDYVDNTKMARFLQTHGIEQIQGPVVCEPKRMIYSAVKEVKKLPTFKK